MKTSTKLIILIFSTMLLLIIIPLILRYIFKISVDLLTISIIANVLVIPLMLITIISTENSSKEHIKSVEESTTKHINSVEDATKKQIESWERWEYIQRKQSIKSLIKEFKLNVGIYGCIQKKSEENNNQMVANNFILTSLAKSLYNSPIDNDQINQKLLDCYYIIKGDDNTLDVTRLPEFSGSSLYFANSILSNFDSKEKIINNTIKMLEEYEQKLELKRYN
jgi:hypothetical protein